MTPGLRRPYSKIVVAPVLPKRGRCRERAPQIDRSPEQRVLEIAWHHADDGGVAPVQPHGAPDYSLVAVEASLPESLGEDHVARLLEAIGVNNLATTDLILDLGDVGPDVGRATLVARSVLAQTPRAAEWRRFVLAAASFPENLSELSAATTSRLPRVEWHLWQRLRRRGVSTRRDIVFGDYAIAHPIPTELDPRTMRMSASIRYTIPDEWLILKGRNVREHGFDQYFELSRQLVQLPDYSGEEFSWADRWIMRCAQREIGPGNAGGRWERITIWCWSRGISPTRAPLFESLTDNRA